jgi:microcystin-dependent protein
VHIGNGIVLGERAGETSHTLILSELPAHTHIPNANSTAGNATTPDPNGSVVLSQCNGLTGSPPSAAFDVNIYAAASGQANAMAPQSVTAVGGNQPHENMSPYLVLNFVIALQGIFPSQN